MQFHLIDLFVVDNFVDRDTEMKQMKHLLLQFDSQNERKIYILYDLDNIDKTQLIIAYARKHQEIYSAIIYVNNNNKDTFF